MPTSFITGIATDTKGFYAGNQRERRLVKVNSRNHNIKIIRSGAVLVAQRLGIDAPTAAPTGTAGTGANLFYRYVYVNKFFTDPLALEVDPYIRSNASPVLTIASVATAATNITPTLSTDTQVTHIWLYVASSSDGPFYRLSSGYEVANTGTPTWTGVTTVPTAGYLLETDNFVPDTCRVVEESNGFYCYAGFIPVTGTATFTNGSATVTVTVGTVFDGIFGGLNIQATGDTTGGPNNDGIHLCKYATSTTLTLIDSTGANRTYDGSTKTTTFRIWRDPSIIQISKRFNPDSTPAPGDADFVIKGPGAVTGIIKPSAGNTLRFHYNSGQKKSVEIADFSEGLPARRITTASSYCMAAPRCYCTIGSRIFYFDTSVGIVEDRGMNHVPISQATIPNLIRSLNMSVASSFEMESDESRNLIFLACAPSGYSKNYYLIVYNLTSDTWNLWFMLPNVFSMKKVYDDDGRVFIHMGSTDGSVTIWPSAGFNEAVGTGISGTLTGANGTTITDALAAFPTTGDSLKDRWVMTWNDSEDLPTYQFARIASNTATVLTLDTFINDTSPSALTPVPQAGDSYWIGAIPCYLGPSYRHNALPDEDGHMMEIAASTDGLSTSQRLRVELFRNLDDNPVMGQKMTKNLLSDGTTDANHESYKAGVTNSTEAVGITGWKIVDNNEAELSLKSLVFRVRSISEQQPKQQPTGM